MARNPKMRLPEATAAAVETNEPRIVTPEIALVPDISGVCNNEGTFLITLYPSKAAITKTAVNK